MLTVRTTDKRFTDAHLQNLGTDGYRFLILFNLDCYAGDLDYSYRTDQWVATVTHRNHEPWNQFTVRGATQEIAIVDAIAASLRHL